MAKFGEIVAYQYRADLYCPDCIAEVVSATLGKSLDNQLGGFYDQSDAMHYLNEIAELLKINREDERTFDSGDFPKVVLFDHLHDQGETFYCGNCHSELVS